VGLNPNAAPVSAAARELARKLGFTPVDEIVVFSRGALH
jgi:hypothetical protein